MKRFIHNKPTGSTLLVVIITGIAFAVVALSISRLSLSNYNIVRRDYNALNALALAEAGADAALSALNADSSYTGTTSCPLPSSPTGTQLYSDTSKGRGIYESCIQAGSLANEKILYARGTIYLPQTNTSPTVQRTVRLVLVGSNNSGNYSVQTGPGGLIMSNSAQISNGEVYVGGKITMSNSAQIGSPANPVKTSVGYYSCPTPATAAYPILCTSGQPISISNTAHIYGDVYANNQTNGSGMTQGGLLGSSGVANTTLPDYDRTAQKTAVSNTLTGAQASCSGSQKVSWPANVHITGNVSTANNCEITILGNAWVDGNITMSNRSIIKVDNTVITQPTIMIDGSTGFNLSNQATLAANAANIGVQIITFWSAASCSPNCTTVTGTDLANSQNTTTISINNQGLGAKTNFYARWSKIRIQNSGTVNKILGQTVELANPGSVSFGLGSSATLGATVWTVQYYERL